MSTTPQLRDVVASLFVEPLHGFNLAQATIIEIWISTLEIIAKMIPDGSEITAEQLKAYLAMAPQWSATVRGDVSVVMRLTSATRSEGSMNLGLSVGPFSAGGSFGLIKESSSESVIQASAQYVISNSRGNVSVLDLLSEMGKTFDPGTTLGAADVLGASNSLRELQSAMP